MDIGLALYANRRPLSMARNKRIGCGSSFGKLALLACFVSASTIVFLRAFGGNNYGYSRDSGYDLVQQEALPDRPAAIVVEDGPTGHKQWTVWVPRNSSFPLEPWQYAEVCAQSVQIQHEINGAYGLFGHKKGYYSLDPAYVEISDAIEAGMLPSYPQDPQNRLHDHIGTCKRSMTFLMQTEEAGMGNMLLRLWAAYGMAQTERRAFFIDDTMWPYGNYTNYFKPPPKASCRPPPSYHQVPCPRTAAHIVVSTATYPFIFGPSFEEEFFDPSAPPKQHHHRTYQLMRSGFEALFHLSDVADATYIKQRTTGPTFQQTADEGGITIGLHIRHGDVHPWQQEYHNDYFPALYYMDEVRQILIDAYEHEDSRKENTQESPPLITALAMPGLSPSRKGAPQTRPRPVLGARVQGQPLSGSGSEGAQLTRQTRRHSPAGFSASRILLASDDPVTYNAPELSRVLRAQDRIRLASKAELEYLSDGSRNKYVDTIHGWDGGFFASAFFGLGMPERRAEWHSMESLWTAQSSEKHFTSFDQRSDGGSRVSDASMVPSVEAMEMRRIVGRAYLLDLSILGKTDAIVCAISTAACRILGVMLGWERLVSGAWHNIDGQEGWMGLAPKPGDLRG